MNDKDKEAFEKWYNISNIDITGSNKDDIKTTWQAACEYKNREYSDLVDARIQTSLNNVKLQAENAKLKEVVKMVENNSLMPHKHDDYYTRLCCLSERASEVLKELEEK